VDRRGHDVVGEPLGEYRKLTAAPGRIARNDGDATKAIDGARQEN